MSSVPGTNWPLLAGARFFLAAIVMVIHLAAVDTSNRLGVFVIRHFNGFTCVAAFFVISGYSLAQSYTRQPEGFFRRRFDRIFPVYWACLAIALAPFLMGVKAVPLPDGNPVLPPPLWHCLSSVLMLQTVVAPRLQIIGQHWTLSIECLFYLCVPLLARLTKQQLTAIFLASLCFYQVLHQTHRDNFAFMLGIVPPAATIWLWLLGWMFGRNPSSEKLRWVLLALLPVLLNQGAISLLLTSTAIVWGHAMHLSKSINSFLTYLGDLSYPLYLLHVPLMYWLWALTRSTNLFFYIAVSLVSSMLVFHGVDAPYRALMRRQKARRATDKEELATASARIS